MLSLKRVIKREMAPKILPSMITVGHESDAGRTRQYPPFLLPALSISFSHIPTAPLQPKLRGLRIQFIKHVLTQGRISGIRTTLISLTHRLASDLFSIQMYRSPPSNFRGHLGSQNMGYPNHLPCCIVNMCISHHLTIPILHSCREHR